MIIKLSARSVSSPHKQRGVALLLALLIVALATIAAVDMSVRQQLDIRRAGNVFLHDQAYLYALAAESYALNLLGRPSSDRELPWEECVSPTVMVAIDSANIEVWVEDLHCRFNINALASEEQALQGFIRLLAAINDEQPQALIQPESLAHFIKDWLDPQTDDPVYRLQSPPYLSGNQLLLSTTEIRLIQGVTDEVWELIAPHITALPTTQLQLSNLEYAAEPIQIALMNLEQQANSASVYYLLNVAAELGGRRFFLCSLLDTQNQEVVLREARLCQ